MDIAVNISDETSVVSQEGFGLTLVLCTTKTLAYKEYDITDDLTAVVPDFAAETEVYKIINTIAGQNPRPQKVAVFGTDLSASLQKPVDIVTALNTLIASYGDWYRLLLDDKTDALIGAVSDWAETNGKSFYTEYANTTFTTDFSAKAKTNLFYKANTDRLDAAVVGYAASRIPGSYIYKFKNLNIVTADALTPTDLAPIKAKNMNAYINKFSNISMEKSQLDEGLAANGKSIDFIESQDWIKYRIMQEIAKLLMATGKLGADDTGILSIVTAVGTALDDATSNNIIKKGTNKKGMYTVSSKSADNLPAEDIAAGKITGITFKYVYLYGVKEVTVNGAVAISLQEVG